jgi:hypothetical protein
LQAALVEASARPELRDWPFLDDVAAVVEGQYARMLTLPSAG